MSKLESEVILREVLVSAFERQFKLKVSEGDWEINWGNEKTNNQTLVSFVTEREGKNLILDARLKMSNTTKVNRFFLSENTTELVRFTTEMLLDNALFADLIAVVDNTESKPAHHAAHKAAQPKLRSAKSKTHEKEQAAKAKTHKKEHKAPTPVKQEPVAVEPEPVKEPTLVIDSITYDEGILVLNFTPFITEAMTLEVKIRNHVEEEGSENAGNDWIVVERLENYLGQAADSVSYANLGLDGSYDIQITSESGTLVSNILPLVHKA